VKVKSEPLATYALMQVPTINGVTTIQNLLAAITTDLLTTIVQDQV
jgi:hypothetical protein